MLLVPIRAQSVKNALAQVSFDSAKSLGLCSHPIGHFIYECKGSRPYVSRPSRTQQLENPKLLAKLKAEGKPSVEVPNEFKSKYARDFSPGLNS